jgi:hypothetical protein
MDERADALKAAEDIVNGAKAESRELTPARLTSSSPNTETARPTR